MNAKESASVETITLAGGCFWCIEAVYKETKGVIDAVPGYAGGKSVNPTYEQVCSGNTGHAETVQVTFNPQQISYREILEVFFTVHDPTTLNRQGADVGTQYRSTIFYHNDTQKKIAKEIIAEMTREKVWKNPIVTRLEPFEKFYPAEAYHRDYFQRHPEQAYCQVVIAPKLDKFRKKWAQRVKD
jgi:peptide-methionine (S)-S-oxide reductase